MSSTTFSYAQAAKGQTISQPSPQLTSSSGPPSIKDDPATANTSVSAPSVTSNDPEVRDMDKTGKLDVEAIPSKLDLEATSNGASRSSAAPTNGHGVRTSREVDTAAQGAQQATDDKSSRSTSRTSRVNEGTESRKTRKGRKGRATDKDSHSEQSPEDEKEKDVPKPVLSEAPPPTINIWEQRKELHKAKLASTPAPVGSPSVPSQESIKDQKESDDAQEPLANGINGDKSAKKPTQLQQASEQVPRRSAPRGSRAAERDEKSTPALPPVVDASSWPDPKAAAAVEETSRKVQDKPETSEKDNQDGSGVTKKKSWKQMELDHSLFGPPMPTRSGKPRGGGRGGREITSTRGSHSTSSASAHGSAGDRAAVVNGTAGPKTGTTRPREGSMQSRTSSQPQPPVPQSAKGTNTFDSQSKDQRKQPTPAAGDQVREAGAEVSASSKRASSVRDVRTEIPGAFDSAPRAAPQDRASHPHQKGADHTGAHGQQFQTREGRPERSRGGYRGRGGHNGGSGSHVVSAYGQNGQYPMQSFNTRQNSGGPSPPPLSGQYQLPYAPHNRGRGNRWPNSGQGAGRNGANGGSFVPKPVQANEFAMSPYQPVLYPESLVIIIRQQIEYYFSVENLCKDYYIRKQMDTQGFVHLSLVAGFKRMQELVKDLEMIRCACAGSDVLDYVLGDDGIERLRNREKWDRFVLARQERNEAAQNDGPQTFTILNRPVSQMYGGPVMHPMYSLQSPVYPGYTEDPMFQAMYVNGLHYEPGVNGDVNGHHYGTETQLSAGVPEFSPPEAPITLESMTQISDKEVSEKLWVGDASEQPDGAAHQGLNGVSSNGVNGEAKKGAAESTTNRPYLEVRSEALEQRQNAAAGETPKLMKEVYKYWSQLLLSQFNGNVYKEFRDLAMHDASQAVPSRFGLEVLLDFYNKLLMDSNGQKPWPQGRAVPDFLVAHFREAKDLEKSSASRSDVAI